MQKKIKMGIKDIVTLISVLTALISVIYVMFNNRKSIYINTVTKARIKYLEELKNNFAFFCSFCLMKITSKKKSFNEDIIRTSYLIKLQLDKDHQFDRKIIIRIDEIINIILLKKDELTIEDINALLELAQELILLEWRGISNEAKYGILSRKAKKNLVDNNLKLY